jgi:aspartate/methionine/tyrosine aminotransferase
VSDRLAAFAMQPDVRENILVRTRGIIRANLPRLEAWIATHPGLRYARPLAGAIAYTPYQADIGSTKLADRIRREHSVLLVPGAMFGGKKAIRFGFGFDIEHTLKGLAKADETLAAVGL